MSATVSTSAAGPMRAAVLALPPGFIAVACAEAPFASAIAAAERGADPGTVLHGALAARCSFAVILAPHRPISDAALLQLGGQAVHDALAALAPEHVPVSMATPGSVDVDGARAAVLAVARAGAMSDVDAAGVPDWMVLGVDIAVDLHVDEPGTNPGLTCLAEEGFYSTAGEVLEATCRALLACIDAWTEAGHSEPALA